MVVDVGYDSSLPKGARSGNARGGWRGPKDPYLRTLQSTELEPTRLVIELRHDQLETLRRNCPVAPQDYLKTIALKLLEQGNPRDRV